MPDIHQEEYTVDELARLLGIGRDVILHDIERGDLKANRVGHHTVCIRREDVLDWLERRGPGV
jgi:excisionase family DNA binding protein